MFIISKQTSGAVPLETLECVLNADHISFIKHKCECYSGAIDTAVSAFNDIIQRVYGSVQFDILKHREALLAKMSKLPEKGKALVQMDDTGYHVMLVEWWTKQEESTGWSLFGGGAIHARQVRYTSFRMENVPSYGVLRRQREMLNLERKNARTFMEQHTRELKEAVEKRISRGKACNKEGEKKKRD